MEYEQVQMFYTQEEVDAKVSEIDVQRLVEVESIKDKTVNTISDNIHQILKDEVATYSLGKDYAQQLYDRFVAEAGLVAKRIASKYEVTVYCDGQTVATFSGIEADDEDSACAEVLDNLDVNSIITMTVSYDGQECEESIDYDSWNLDFTAEAVEE